MADHVYARVSGFGLTLVPFAPFQYARLPDATRSILAVHNSPAGTRQATIIPKDMGPEVQLGRGTKALAEVLDLQAGPSYDHWRIETTVFTVRWPDGFLLISEPKPPGFYFRGPEEALIYLQGPLPRECLPALTAMVGPGQQIRRHGEDWVELEYQHDGMPCRQNHRVIDVGSLYALVVTAQSPEQLAELTDNAAEEVAGSLAPFQRE